jgi:hypothetical protein
MSIGRLRTLIASRAFGVAASATLAVLLGLYVYERVRTAGSPDLKLNVSCFAYRDLNRNGSYDLGERPYAGLEVAMQTPAGTKVVATSNVAGFANFTMSRRARSADIRVEGNAAITVRPPGGWTITTGNGEQAATFRFLAGSPAGIVMEQTFQPVGIAPALTISGRIERGSTAGGPVRGVLRATSPRGVESTVELSPAGRFSLPAEAGEWRLDYMAGGARITRRIQVGAHPVEVGTLAIARVEADARRRTVIATFDSLGRSNQVVEVPNGYAGLRWYNWVAIYQHTLESVGMVNATVSGEYVAYNSSGHAATISSGQPFDFVGGFVGVLWPEGERGDVIVRAWRADQLVYEDRFRARIAGPVYFDADYRDVTRIEFASATYWQLGIDDLQFRIGGATRD